MKEETKLQKCIKQIETVVKEYHLTPSQYRYCVKMVRNNLHLQTINTPTRLPDYLNPAEIHFFIQKAYSIDAFTGILSKFLILTGLRISEARNLRVMDLDFANLQLKVVQGKGKKDRYVPLATSLAQEMQQFLNNRKTGYVFAKKNETAYSKRALQYMIDTVIDACAFQKHITTHSLRHTFACLCISKGLRLEQIQLIMGHSSRITTEIYAKLELGSVKTEFLQLMGGI